MGFDLKAREADIQSQYTIRKNGKGYTLSEQDSHYSDSFNPKGDWVNYETEIKTYKTLSGAVKALIKLVTMHFPAGYFNEENDINEFVKTMIQEDGESK